MKVNARKRLNMKKVSFVKTYEKVRKRTENKRKIYKCYY